MIDLYCERLSADFWAEPVNALTNLAFLLAAALSWQLAGKAGRRSPGLAALLIVMAGIGIGSFLFHTFATRWAMLADVLPILVFQLLYLWLYTGAVTGLRRAARIASVAALLLALLLSTRLAAYANGSLVYLPALLTLLILGVHYYRHGRPGNLLILMASGVFSLSLGLRTVDMAICEGFALGTHFGWHLLNALVLYLVTRALLLARHANRPVGGG